jgi:hypothetical protein
MFSRVGASDGTIGRFARSCAAPRCNERWRRKRLDVNAPLGFTLLLLGRSLVLRILGTVTLPLSLCGAGGCNSIWQANNASQGVQFNSSKIGTGEPAYTPAGTSSPRESQL